MAKRLPNIQIRRQRWLEFADFMESLPEQKFNHGEWCEPDHTCKTTACVAGWGAIQYSDKVKNWLKATFAKQVAEKRLNKLRSPVSLDKQYAEVSRLEEEVNNFSTFEWADEGQKVLYLSSDVAYLLFYPHSSFWFRSGTLSRIKATNKDIALIFRYLSTFRPKDVKLPRNFVREEIQAVVDAHFKKEV